MTFTIFLTYSAIALLSFLLNIPFGAIRARYPRMSLPWFFWIHASIPFLILARVVLNTSAWFIPVTIALAIGGQLLGARFGKKTDIQPVKEGTPREK